MDKLELSITLENKEQKFGMYACYTYWIHILVIKKDKRFEDNQYRGNVLYYSLQNKMTIASHWSYKRGFISENMVYLPSVQNLNETISIKFSTDSDRKIFLNRFYNSLKLWSKNWNDFKYDIDCKFEIKENIWKITYKNNFPNQYYG